MINHFTSNNINSDLDYLCEIFSFISTNLGLGTTDIDVTNIELTAALNIINSVDIQANGVVITQASNEHLFSVSTEGNLNTDQVELCLKQEPKEPVVDGTKPQAIRIEAEDADRFFDTTELVNLGGAYRNDGLDVEVSGDVGGGYNVGWVEAGEYLEYDLDIATAGTYDLSLRVASDTWDTKEIAALINGEDMGQVSFGHTGGWQSYTDVTISGIELEAGSQQLRLDLLDSKLNINYLDLIPVPDAVTPIHIEAEDAVRFYDTTELINLGGAYRNDGLDVEASGVQDGGYNVGWIEQGEYLEYDINVAESGNYDILLRVATDIFDLKEIEVSIDDHAVGQVSFGHTGGWQSYTDVIIEDVSIEAGTTELRLDMLDSQFNIDYIELV